MEKRIFKLAKISVSLMLIVMMSISNLLTVLAEQTTIWVSRPTAESRIVDDGFTYGYGPGAGGQGASAKRFYSIHDNESITSPIYYYTVPRVGGDGSPTGRDIPGYCIQPGKKNGALSGMVNNFNDSLAWKRFSEEQKVAASVILLYGYRYDMNDNPIFLNRPLGETGYSKESAYVATQILLWEVVENMRVDLTGYNDNYIAPNGAPQTQTNQYWTSVIQGKPAYNAYVSIISSMAGYFLKPDYVQKSFEKAMQSPRKLTYSGGKYFVEVNDQNTVDNTGLQIGDFSSISVSYQIDGENNVTTYSDFATKVDGWYTYSSGVYSYQGNHHAEIILNSGKEGGIGNQNQDLGLKIDFGRVEPTNIKIELAKKIEGVESFNQTGIVFWSDKTNIKIQDRVSETPIEPIMFFMIVEKTDLPIPPSDSNERVIYEPNFDYPEFQFDGLKLDTEQGFDNQNDTPRGDGSLSATFSGEWTIDTGGDGSFTMQADHNGKGASETIHPWNNMSDLNKILTHDTLGQVIGIELKGTFQASIKELPPEGYLSEEDSESGTGIRNYEVTYNGKTHRNATDIVYPVLTDDGSYKWSEDESSYTGFLKYCELNGIDTSLLPDADDIGASGFTYAGSSNVWHDVTYKLDGGYDGLKTYTGAKKQKCYESDGCGDYAISPENPIHEDAWKVEDFTYQVAMPEPANGSEPLTYYNRVIKGMYHLTKNISDSSLCPFVGAEGNNPNEGKPMSQIPWSLELISDSTMSENPEGIHGSEGEKFTMLAPIAVGQSGYIPGGGAYRVITGGNKNNNAFGTINSQSGAVTFPNEDGAFLADADNKKLLTGNGGDLYIYDIPVGTYKLTELHCDKNVGYVMEVTYFTIEKTDEQGNNIDYLINFLDGAGQESGINVVHESLTNYIIRNEIEVVKKDAETGKTIPSDQTAFRIRYLGLPETAGGVLDLDATCNACGKLMKEHQGGYLVNPQNSKGNGYEYVFYTDVNGKIQLPYKLEYGSYQLEEITAPEGYYIGTYDEDGNASITNGNQGFDATVPFGIYNSNGELVTWNTQLEYENGLISDSELVYNYYPFVVEKQEDREEGNPLPVAKIVVEIRNNATKGMVEVSKLADILVGFKKVETIHGLVYQPVYEKKPKAGVSFDIISAEDVMLHDGVEAPELYDALGKLIALELKEFNHNQFPDALRTYYSKLEDGSEAYYITEADGDFSDTPHDKNMTYATLLTPKEKGSSYVLEFQEVVESQMYGKYTNHYKYIFGLEYAAGGFDFSDIEMEKRTTFEDYTGFFAESQMPTLLHGNGDSYTEIPIENQTFQDGNQISSVEMIDEIGELSTQMIMDSFGDEVKQYNEDYVIVTPEEDQDGNLNRPALPSGYLIDEINMDTMYVIYSEDNKIDTDYDGDPDKKDYMVYVKDKNGTSRFIHCNEVGDSYLSRVQKVTFKAIQHTNSQNGYKIIGFREYGQYENEVMQFINTASKEQEMANVDIRNPYKNGKNARNETVRVEAIDLSVIAGDATTVSGDDTHKTILVKQSSKQPYYQFKDGVQTNISYSGGFTKTQIKVPLTSNLPEIFTKSTFEEGNIVGEVSIDYLFTGDPAKVLSPINPLVEYIVDENGNYIRSKLVSQTQIKENGEWIVIPGYRLIEIVSNAKTEEVAIKVRYPDERMSFSILTEDLEHSSSEEPIYRGQLVVSAETKTIKSTIGTIIETITTDEGGTAISSPLPLGTYYIRERDSKDSITNQQGSLIGLVGSKEVYMVELTYGGQYVPLVWASSTIENHAVGVQLDLSKGFQKTQGGEEYIPKAGAVFGVFTYDNEIKAKIDASNSVVDLINLNRDMMVGTLITDEKGKAVSSLLLPFGNYYVKEIVTLLGYELSDEKFVFRLDEDTNADALTFHMYASGIDGKVNFTGFDTTEVTIYTKYQIPSLKVTINGETFDTQIAVEKMVGNVNIKNVVVNDISTMTLTILSGSPADIKFENGAGMQVTSNVDSYDVVFRNPESGVWNHNGEPSVENPYSINTGTTTNITFDPEVKKAMYTPKIAFTGYTAKTNMPYIPLEESIVFMDGSKARFEDDISGKREFVIYLPKRVMLPVYYTVENGEKRMPSYYSAYYSLDQTPEMKELPSWLSYDVTDSTVNKFMVDISKLPDSEIASLLFGDAVKDVVHISKTEGGSSIESYELTSLGGVDIWKAPKVLNKKNQEIVGFQKSGITISKTTERISFAQVDKKISLHSENQGAVLEGVIMPGGQSSKIKVLVGNVTRALMGRDDITSTLRAGEVALSKGQSMIISMADGSTYQIEMDMKGILKMEVTGIINGALSIDANAPHVELDGSIENIKDIDGELIIQTFPLEKESREEISLRNILKCYLCAK